MAGKKQLLTPDERFMKEAIRQAKKAESINEVPIGCVIVYENHIIARGYNKRNLKKTTLAHAEIIAITYLDKIVNIVKSISLRQNRMYCMLRLMRF